MVSKLRAAVYAFAAAVLGVIGVYVPLSDAVVAAWLQLVLAGSVLVVLVMAVWKTWPGKVVKDVVDELPEVPEVPDVIGLVDMNDADNKATDA